MVPDASYLWLKPQFPHHRRMHKAAGYLRECLCVYLLNFSAQDFNLLHLSWNPSEGADQLGSKDTLRSERRG